MTVQPWSFQLRLVCTELPENFQLQFRLSNSGTGPMVVFTHEFLPWLAVTPCIHLSVSPVLWVVVHPLSSPLLWIQEVLLIFQSVQLFACRQDGVVTSKFLTCRTRNWKSPYDFLETTKGMTHERKNGQAELHKFKMFCSIKTAVDSDTEK